MAGKLSCAALVVAIATVAALLEGTSAAVYVVGDSLGWAVPSSGATAYSNWASQHTFAVGDILVFNYATGNHDVARVTRDAFNGCNSTSPLNIITIGPTNFTLSNSGEYYFICTFGQHCVNGQKLAINVTSTSGPASPPATPPTSPSPVPSPTTPPPASPPPATPPTAPSPATPPTAPSPATPPTAPSPATPPTTTPSPQSSPPPASSPGPSGTTSPPPPPAAATPTGSSPPPADTTVSPPPPNSAPPKAVATFALVFMSIAIGFLYC